MAELLRPTRTAPERILAYGPEKAGKSSLWFDVIRNALKYGYDGKFYVVDTDRTWGKMADAELQGGWGEIFEYRTAAEIQAGEPHPDTMVIVYEPFDLKEALVMSKDIGRVVHRRDWTIIDMADWFWDEAQHLYIREVHGDEPDNYFLEIRREIKEAKESGRKGHEAEFGGQAGMDWVFITKVYKQFELPLTIKSRNHVFMVSGEKKLDPNRGASNDQIKLYKPANGWAAAGQKGIGHRCDTLIRMTKTGTGRRQITMVGDRGREAIWEEVVEGRTLDIGAPPRAFVSSYLKKIGGWETPRPRRRRRGTT